MFHVGMQARQTLSVTLGILSHADYIYSKMAQFTRATPGSSLVILTHQLYDVNATL